MRSFSKLVNALMATICRPKLKVSSTIVETSPVQKKQLQELVQRFGNTAYTERNIWPTVNKSFLTQFYAPLNILRQPAFQTQQIKCFSISSVLGETSGVKGSTPIPSNQECCTKEQRTVAKNRIKCPIMPPCLRFVQPPGKTITDSDINKMECGRICMPCCPKARYPPVCYFPTDKPPCCKIPNPRPAFSECEKDCFKAKPLCDCCFIKPPPCRLLPEVEQCS